MMLLLQKILLKRNAMKLGRVRLLALAASVCLSGSLFGQVEISKQAGGVTVKTSTDTLHLTICSPTSIHVVASPDGTAEAATPQQPWLIKQCTPSQFTLTMPRRQAPQSENDKLWNAAVAVVDPVRSRSELRSLGATSNFRTSKAIGFCRSFRMLRAATSKQKSTANSSTA
jgi:hypothetical protein